MVKLYPFPFVKLKNAPQFHRWGCSNNLKSMESQKQFYCHEFIKRAKVETTFDKLMSCVQDSEPRIRAYYSHNIKLTPGELVKVIFLDCCFIFELFLRHNSKDDDAIASKPWLKDRIFWDLLLLENQLPFFVLQELYNLAFASCQNDSESRYPSFLELTFNFFGYYNKLGLSATDASIKHFTDLLRTFHLQPSNERPRRKDEPIKHFNSATELNEAGVKFEVIKQPDSKRMVNKKGHCLLKLEKKSTGCSLCYLLKGPRRLKIPEIRVEDKTEILFRNMVALEQCHYPRESYVTDYVVVLGFLVKTGKDVDLLVKKKIIVNWIGDSNAVAKLFNGLGTNIIQVSFNSDYVDICKDLDDFCDHPWYSRKATLRRDYCNTPWKKIASFAAILVIILTIIQTVCSILQVVQQL